MSSQRLALAHFAETEFEEKRSRFIGLAYPLAQVDEAEVILAEVRKRFPDARHHVYAYKCTKPQTFARYSDDGEPQGTGGRPVLEVLNKQGIDEGLIIVVRYFGGILLGAGGLTRAYGRAAADAVRAAGLLRYERRRLYSLELPYDRAERFQALLRKKPSIPEPTLDYAAAVRFTLALTPAMLAELEAPLAELSQGQVSFVPGEWLEVPLPYRAEDEAP